MPVIVCVSQLQYSRPPTITMVWLSQLKPYRIAFVHIMCDHEKDQSHNGMTRSYDVPVIGATITTKWVSCPLSCLC